MSQAVLLKNGILKSRSLGALVLTIFGTFWALCALVGLNGAAGWLPLVVVGLIAIVLFVTSIRLVRAVRRMSPEDVTPEEKERSRKYRLLSLLQSAAMMVAVLVLSLTHHQEYILPVWALIVGLHFFALVSILQRQWYSIVGLVMCGLTLLSVLLLPVTAQLGGTQIFLWVVVIGSGCALILWSTVVETLLQIRVRMRQRDWLAEAYVRNTLHAPSTGKP